MPREFPLLALAALLGVTLGRVVRRSRPRLYPVVIFGVVLLIIAGFVLYLLRAP